MKTEIRSAQVSELRAESDGKLRGYAAVFNKRSLDLGGFVEIIQPGAFRKTLESGDDVKALIDHKGIAIARKANGTLELVEDDVGLGVVIDLPDTTAGRDIRTSVDRGDVDQMSFMFSVREGGAFYDETEDGSIQRTLTDVVLGEVSIVTFPAYPDTKVASRSVQEWRDGKTLASLVEFENRRGLKLRELQLKERRI